MSAYQNPAPRLAVLLCALLFLAGCATPTPNRVDRPAAVATAVADSPDPLEPAETPMASETDPLEPPASSLPRIELKSADLYRFLLGDVAEQRGMSDLAADAYLELAKTTRDPRVARRAVETAVRAGRMEHALQAAKLWDELMPGLEAPKQMVVALSLKVGRTQDAEPYLARMFAAKPEDAPQAFLQLHRFWPADLPRADAADMTSRLAEPYPAMPEAQLAMGVAQMAAGRLDLALVGFDRALALKPGWEGAILLKAQALEALQPADATRFLGDMSKAYPNLPNLALNHARRLAAEKRYEDSRAEYQKLVNQFPRHGEALVGLGLINMQLHHYPEAEKSLQAALDTAPRNPDTLYYYLGQIAEEQWEMEKARTWYERVSSGDNLAAARLRLPRVLVKLGKVDEALALARALPADNPDARTERAQVEAQVLRESRRYAEALRVLEGIIKDNPENLDLIYDRSLIHDYMGNLQGAIRDLRKYLSMRPQSVLALNALGYTMANRNHDLNEAEGYLSQALALDPNNPVIIDSMGWLRYRQGRIKEARELIANAYGRLRDPEVGAHYGEILWQLGQRDEARKVWAESRKLDPANETIEETLKRFPG